VSFVALRPKWKCGRLRPGLWVACAVVRPTTGWPKLSITLSRALRERMGWEISGRIGVELGFGADRGLVRLHPDASGYTLCRTGRGGTCGRVMVTTSGIVGARPASSVGTIVTYAVQIYGCEVILALPGPIQRALGIGVA